jgi:hypothetical protein
MYESNCTTDIVIELGKNCTLLKLLDIKNSALVTDDCVEYLLKLRNLEILKIGGTSISEMTYSLILSALPKIMNVHWCGAVDIILQNITKEYLPSVKEFFGAISDVSLLRKMCPHIIQLRIALQGDNSFGPLHLTRVTSLDILFCDFNGCSLKPTFALMGIRLTSLCMYNIEDVNMFAIISCCSVLEILAVKRCSLKISEDIIQVLELPHFRSVKVITLESNRCFNNFCMYLRYYANLVVFHAQLVIEIHDASVGAILNAGGFRNISEIVLRECGPLSLFTAQLLIKRCDNLCSLGSLKTWSGVSDDDITSLIEFAKINNLALTVA